MTKISTIVLMIAVMFGSCLGVKKAASENLLGAYVYIDSTGIEYGDICFITLDSSRFSYSCHIMHSGTTVQGVWKKIDHQRVVLKIDKYDILPTYPETFYHDIDTFTVLSTNKIKLNHKLFIKGTDSTNFWFHGAKLK